ncbi:ATP-binding cassette domain-containing protein [Azospirillum sp. TSO35-2]|uniref:ABC transporter ATP-binding protein n=1 Tax=Azospirillum sp. TSO35-2 TaxID=716796 RepID=UPI0018EE6E37|nr:ATP-binding cassette domain-containing protein [Azospirillum sp. TSO35-2]
MEALRGLTIAAAAGEVVALVGPSGCGKTTALGIVAGLDHDFDGSVTVGPRPDGGAARLGYVFQEPRLLPWRTVRQNLALALPRPQRKGPAVDAMLAALDLTALADRFPTQLSLGMARRVALARAFVVEPDLLLMDEPFVSLDEPTALKLRALLVGLLDRRPATVLLVTHNLREALALADRLLLLAPSPGRVVAEVPVAIPRADRDDAAIEALRGALLARPEPAFRLLA